MAVDYEGLLRDLVTGLAGWFQDPQAGEHSRMTRDLYPYRVLFSPLQVNQLWLKNRIVMGPMGNANMADEMGRPGNKLIQYFAERARGGVGLITSGLVPVSQGIDPSVTEPGDRSLFPRIDRSRTALSGWRILAETIHAHGSRFFIQLTPGLGRVGSPECLLTKHRLPVSASWNPNFYMPQVPCRPLTDLECSNIIRRMGQAAADAKALLVDGVYVHGHEGYLLEQMTNRAFNRRKLSRFADPQTFGIELIRELRARTGAAYPIMYRIDLSHALGATYGVRLDSVPGLRKFRGERSIAESLEYMVNLVAAGVDLFDVDLGGYDNWWLPHPPGPMPPGAYLGIARLVKEYFEEKGLRSVAGLPVPVVGVGKLGYPDLAEQALREGCCDLVMLARPLLADPAWPNKVYAGKVDEIVPCIGDQEACLNEIFEGGHIQCAVNPRAGFEDVLPAQVAPAARRKRVAVVGAGPAGIVCACTAAERGHEVTLFEKRDCAGGMLVPGATPHIKFDVANYLAYLHALLERRQRDGNLLVRWQTEATAVLLAEEGFDAIVTCTGGRPITPPVPGVDLPHVVQAIDLLRDPRLAAGAGEVLVVGGGTVGCETAYFLAYELGMPVTVIEMRSAFMMGACTANRGFLIHYLEQKGVRLLNCARLVCIEPRSATIVRNFSRSVPDPYVTWTPLLPDNVKNPLARPVRLEEQALVWPADLVVLAAGLLPDDTLRAACVAAGAAAEVHNIGDSFGPGRVFEAVKAGYAIANAL